MGESESRSLRKFIGPTDSDITKDYQWHNRIFYHETCSSPSDNETCEPSLLSLSLSLSLFVCVCWRRDSEYLSTQDSLTVSLSLSLSLCPSLSENTNASLSPRLWKMRLLTYCNAINRVINNSKASERQSSRHTDQEIEREAARVNSAK